VLRAALEALERPLHDGLRLRGRGGVQGGGVPNEPWHSYHTLVHPRDGGGDGCGGP